MRGLSLGAAIIALSGALSTACVAALPQAVVGTPPQGPGTPYLYVSDYHARTVTVFDKVGHVLQRLRGLASPTALAMDSQADLYVLDAHSSAVSVYKPYATLPFEKLTSPSLRGNYAAGMTVAPNGNVYVSFQLRSTSGYHSLVVVYDSGETSPSGYLESDSETQELLNVATDSQNDVYVAYVWYDYSGSPGIVEWETGDKRSQSLNPKLENPVGINVRKNGDIVICDLGYGSTNPVVETFDPRLQQPLSSFAVPCGNIALDKEQTHIYVGQGTMLTRYDYPAGTNPVKIGTFTGVDGIAVVGALTN